MQYFCDPIPTTDHLHRHEKSEQSTGILFCETNVFMQRYFQYFNYCSCKYLSFIIYLHTNESILWKFWKIRYQIQQQIKRYILFRPQIFYNLNIFKRS